VDTDSSLLVQHAAAEQLGFLKDLHGVDSLIRLLQNTEDRGVKIVVFASLRRITGMTFGRDEEAWQAWWTNHRQELLPGGERAGAGSLGPARRAQVVDAPAALLVQDGPGVAAGGDQQRRVGAAQRGLELGLRAAVEALEELAARRGAPARAIDRTEQ